jgi:hypothetical protein
MPLTERQTHLASIIDKYVKQTIRNGGSDEDLLVSMYDYMGTFKQLMDSSTHQEMDELPQRYDGFYRFALLLELLAEGIANGTIPVPEYVACLAATLIFCYENRIRKGKLKSPLTRVIVGSKGRSTFWIYFRCCM